MQKFRYDINLFPFIETVKSLFEINDLTLIHKEWSQAISYDLLDDVVTDQSTVFHKHFYDYIEKTNWYKIYNSFLVEVIQPLFDEPIIFQKIPTFRVHQPNNLAVAAFHRDSDYNHSKHEINFFLPLTKAFGNNSIWVESEVDKGDYKPLETEIGEFWMWNGAILMHGNKLNDTNMSRVSVDFRVLPLSKYEESSETTVTHKTKMAVGGYWKTIMELSEQR